ncbi:MAG: DUF6531 domain-containing protein, partial [Verrucomicrobiota bacterium]
MGLFLGLVVPFGQPNAENFEITDLHRAGGGFRIEHESDTNFYYRLYRGNSPSNLLEAIDMALGVAGQGEFSTVPSNLVFYRVLRLDQAAPEDLDGDGMDDVYELRHIGLNPFDPADAALDLDDDGITNLREFQTGTDPGVADPLTTLAEVSPADGEQGVAVTRETILRFSHPLDPMAVVDTNMVHATFGGNSLTGRLHVGGDRMSTTLFYDEPLPPLARVRVTVNGNGMKDFGGRDVDVDGDGHPGGLATFDFDTLSLTVVTNTIVCGRVFASELQLVGGSNQWVNQPLGGVRVTVDGAESNLFAVTDGLGDFRLDPAPAGAFFVHIDGTSATNAVPPGAYYPSVGKSWVSVPGEEVNIGNVYLPLVASNTLQAVSTNEDTVIGFPPHVLLENPEWTNVSITVPAGSLLYDDGSPGSMVGIAPVDPDRLPGTLPEGLQFPLVITVQSDGARNFDEPAPICMPNLPDPLTGEVLPPGSKTALWSFNHDAGRWEVVGTMTVSEDGTLACTDPGVGIRAPGWHGALPAAIAGGGGYGGFRRGGLEPRTYIASGRNPTDPIHLFSGAFFTEVTDLRIPGRGFDFAWKRTYRSSYGIGSALGHRWDFSHNVFLESDGPANPVPARLFLCSGTGRRDLFRQKPGTTNVWIRNEFFQEIERHPGGDFTMAFADGTEWRFHPLDGATEEGKLEAVVDRNGNTLGLNYDPVGRLTNVVDTLDRSISLHYGANGFIERVRDFAGREVVYTYYDGVEPGGNAGDLKSVTTPTVTGTPNGNDFPAGKTTRYTYSTGFADDRMNHNL